jgi:glycosyltransferase involved in cell wall biosynthesis
LFALEYEFLIIRKNLTAHSHKIIEHIPNQSLQMDGQNPRLLFYTHALVGGGAEKVWVQTAAGLAGRGHHVEFCTDWDATANAHLIPPGMVVHRLGANHLAATWRLRRILAKGRYFAAFSAVGASNLKLLAAAALSRSDTHIVLSQHGHYEAESRFLGRLGYRLTPLTSRSAARTIVVSDALKDDLGKRFGADLRKVVRIYNAIALPPEAMVPDTQELVARAPTVLAVGRLVAEKDHETLLRAIAIMPQDVTLVICGEGPHLSFLRSVAAALGIGGRVNFAGYHQDLSPFYRAAKVLALPSQTEAFGTVVVEAMGYGLPVVATRCGGPAEILGNGRFGRIVPVGVPEAMAAALTQAIEKPGLSEDHRSRAESFSVDRILDEYEALITALAEPLP